jgi:general secretion pathway protein D
MPDVRTSQLVVVATEKEIAAVDELVQRLDTQTKQVLIEARLIETTINPSTTKGVDWTGTLAAQHVTMGNNAFGRASGGGGTMSAPIESGTSPVPGALVDSSSAPGLLMNASKGSFFNPSMAFLNADGVSAVLSFLNTYSESKVLSTPRTVTLDNEEAHIEVGTQYPIVNTTAGTANTTGGSQVTYSNLTVSLRVTPRISANDYVNLKVSPSVIRLGPLVTSTVGGVNNAVNSFYTRQVETHVLIPSGNTLVMGGLVSDEVDSSNTKVPLLGDIPVLGYLFRSDSKNRNKQNLLIFITPTIVQDGNFQPTKTDFLKTPVPTTDSLEKDWSAWDSGKPKDWSQKAAKPDFQDPDTMAK